MLSGAQTISLFYYLIMLVFFLEKCADFTFDASSGNKMVPSMTIKRNIFITNVSWPLLIFKQGLERVSTLSDQLDLRIKAKFS